MSHHRETVTADGAPDGRGALLARRQVQRPDLPLRPDAARSRAPASSSRASIGDQARRCLDNLTIVAAAAGAQLADAVRVGDLRDRHLRRSRTSTRPTRTLLPSRPAGAHHDRRRRAAARRRGRDRRDHRRPRLMGTVTADDVAAARPAVETVARRTPILSTRTISERAGGDGRAQGREPAAHRLVQGPRRRGQARRAGRRGLRARRRRRLGRQPRPGARRRRARRAACRARCSCPTDAPIAKVEAARGAGRDRPHRRRLASTSASSAALERARRGRARVRPPVRRPGDRRRPGLARARAARGRARPRARSSCPVGGGGLCAGIAIAIKAARPDVEVVGVQAAACAPYPESLRRGEPMRGRPRR